MKSQAMILFVSLMAASLSQGAAPKTVFDYYKLLAAAEKVDAVLLQQGKDWKYVQAIDGEEVSSIAAPIVDVRNGYLHAEYGLSACDKKVLEVALFTAAGNKRFVAVGFHDGCMEAIRAGLSFYEFKGEAFSDALAASGDLSGVKFSSFFEEKKQAEADAVEEAVQLEYALPRQGLTVVVRPIVQREPNTGVDQTLGPKAEALASRSQKFQALELTWSSKDARFTFSAKKPR